nr:hypothetical protein B0A51_05346 [Rachicladosporium sp. CCFEE 5018]
MCVERGDVELIPGMAPEDTPGIPYTELLEQLTPAMLYIILLASVARIPVNLIPPLPDITPHRYEEEVQSTLVQYRYAH